MSNIDNSLTPIDVDLSDVQSFDPVPNDIYRVAIVSVKNQRRSLNNPENVVWDLVLQIVEGEYAKRKLFTSLVYGPGCAGFMDSFLRAFDLLNTDSKQLTVNPTEWIGKIGYVKTEQEEYNGKLSAKVKSYVVRT